MNITCSSYNELLENPFRVFDDFYHGLAARRNSHPQMFEPRSEVVEKENHYFINMDLPGLSEKDIDIEVKDGMLSISGERKNESCQSGYSERLYGSFQRSFSLPKGISHGQIEASFNNGVLTIAVAKPEETKPKKIQVGSGNLFKKLLK